MKKTIPNNKLGINPDISCEANFHFALPTSFLMLCRLMDITPEELLGNFIDNLSHGSWKREGRERAREHLVNYFIAHGYGQHHYAEADIREMFRQMDAVSLLFPKHADDDLLDLYTQWRDAHWQYWFKEWFGKTRRMDKVV